MSYYLEVDNDRSFPLASNHGWGDFIRWADGLVDGDAGEIRHLAEHGWSQNVSELLDQLEAAGEEVEGNLLHTVNDLIATLRAYADGAEVVGVTDGTASE